MLKSYEELRKIDVLPFCEVKKEKDAEIAYLNWAKCVDLLHQNGATVVTFSPITNPKTGTPLYYDDITWTDKSGVTNRDYWTVVEVRIDDAVYQMTSPLMNGLNPVKDNSLSQQRVWNSITRSFVKCVAINTGLGFDLWLKGEMTEAKEASRAKDDNILNIRERVFEKMTWLNKHDLTMQDVADKLGMGRDDFEYKLRNVFKEVLELEQGLDKVVAEVSK